MEAEFYFGREFVDICSTSIRGTYTRTFALFKGDGYSFGYLLIIVVGGRRKGAFLFGGFLVFLDILGSDLYGTYV
eukprot:8070532-Ditylum_brightwellii.AAC.1